MDVRSRSQVAEAGEVIFLFRLRRGDDSSVGA